MLQLGHVSELVRYPVKSMAGIPVVSMFLGWHGFLGDRRFAFRRLGDDSGFPWLSASRLPELLLYHPVGLDESSGEPLPKHVLTPDRLLLEIPSAELRKEIASRLGADVELMKLKHGIFDDAAVSVISTATIAGIGHEVGMELDSRRFRANIVLKPRDQELFLEDQWIGETLVFGISKPHPALYVTSRDLRCMMINLDPDTAIQDSRIMKAVVLLNANNAGVYGTVVQPGTISVGDPVNLVFTSHY